MPLAGKVLSQNVHTIPLVAPIADAFAGTVVTAPFNMKEAHAATFLVWWGVGATGTTTITVEACDDTVPTTTSAVTFRSRVCSGTDVWSAITERTTAGFLTTAGSAQAYLIEVDADVLGPSGYKYLRLKCVEGTDSPILGGILAQLQMRKPRAIQLTQVT